MNKNLNAKNSQLQPTSAFPIVSQIMTSSINFSWSQDPIFFFPLDSTQSATSESVSPFQPPFLTSPSDMALTQPLIWPSFSFPSPSTSFSALSSNKVNCTLNNDTAEEQTHLVPISKSANSTSLAKRTKKLECNESNETKYNIYTIGPSTSNAFAKQSIENNFCGQKNPIASSSTQSCYLAKKRKGIPKSSSTSNLVYAKCKSRKLSLTVGRNQQAAQLLPEAPIPKSKDFVLKKLRPRELAAVRLRSSRSPALKKAETIESTSSKINKEERQGVSPFQIEEPIVVGDYSNPFDVENGDFFQQKVRDAIDLNRFLWLVDNFGFCKRPIYRPFLLRNLCYMQRKPDKLNLSIPIGNTAKKIDKLKVSTIPFVAIKQLNETLKSQPIDLENAESSSKPLMPSTIKFNFIRNNLCFGDRSAIVQCFCASEIDYEFGAFKRIPSATFDMKVNEKLSHVSIDLPESFGHDFLTNSKAKVEYFVVRVVFRYEDAEVGGGKRLRKVPSRQQSSPTDKHENSRKSLRHNHSIAVEQSSQKRTQEVVMFGTKQVVSYSADYGLNVVHGETSIVLHTSEDLKISNDSDGWMEDPSFLARILRLQRKTYDNSFMSIQVQNVEDDDDESSDDEEDGNILNKKTEKKNDWKRKNVKKSKLKNLEGNEIGLIVKSKKVNSKVFLSEDEETDDDNGLIMRKPTSKHCGRSKKKLSSFSSISQVYEHKSILLPKQLKSNKDNSSLASNIEQTKDIDETQISDLMLPFPFSSDDYLKMGKSGLPEKFALQFVVYLAQDNAEANNAPLLGSPASTIMNTQAPLFAEQNFSQIANDLCNVDGRESTLPETKDLPPIQTKPVDSTLIDSENEILHKTMQNCPSAALKEELIDNDFENETNLACGRKRKCCSGAIKTTTKNVIRVLNTSYMCFFCLTQMSFKSLNALFMHFRLCHLRFNFEYKTNISVARNLILPGFIVTLNENASNSCEINPTRHYVKLYSEHLKPKKNLAQVEPIWIVTKRFAKQVRNSWHSFEKTVENTELYNSTLFQNSLLIDGGIRHGTRYCFEPPTKINHEWMIHSNSRNMSEITDLHPLERTMMQLWNKFLLDIRITLLGHKMIYKASRVFVETSREIINQRNLKIHFLFHLTNLVTFCCLDEEERYDLFMRLDPSYSPCFDRAHFISRQVESLNRERLNNSKSVATKQYRSNGNETNLQAVACAGATDSAVDLSTAHINSLEDLRTLFPFASARRLKKIWKFIDVYTFDDFSMLLTTPSTTLPANNTITLTLPS